VKPVVLLARNGCPGGLDRGLVQLNVLRAILQQAANVKGRWLPILIRQQKTSAMSYQAFSSHI
jgi:hypothetical protein